MIPLFFSARPRALSLGRFGFSLGCAALLLACGGESPSTEGEKTVEAGEDECSEHADCDDGRFCNGFESCVAGKCEADVSPCLSTQTCREGAKACETKCEETKDADGDGSIAQNCGGDDCDDSDAMSFPGGVEVCDEFGRDEDCNPNTFGEMDSDEDGAISAQCCNGFNCGDDCDDENAQVKPRALEICDGLDNDCNDKVDDAPPSLYPEWYIDADRDGARAPGSEPVLECAVEKPGYTISAIIDCDDENEDRTPHAQEVCDGLDNDCDESTHACTHFVGHLGDTIRSQPIQGMNAGVTSPQSFFTQTCPEGTVMTEMFRGGVNFTPSSYFLRCVELAYDSTSSSFSATQSSCVRMSDGAVSSCPGGGRPNDCQLADGLPFSVEVYGADRTLLGSCHADDAYFEGTTFHSSDVGYCPEDTVLVGAEIGVKFDGDYSFDARVLCSKLTGREYLE